MAKKPRIFYGWWILAACFVMGMYSSGVIWYGFTALFDPIVKEFGWSYAEISWASSLRGMEVGLLAPFVGYLIDRLGARPVLFFGGIITGVGVVILSRVNSLVMFYLALGLVCIGLSAVSSTAMIAALVKWFHRRSSMVMGIMVSGFGFSGFMVPVMVKLIDSLGWRQALFVLGIGLFVVILPLSLVVRRSPEEYGLLPDGDSSGPITRAVQNAAVNTTNENNLSRKEALLNPTFWFFALAFMLQQLMTSAVTTHVMPYLASLTITRDVGGLIATGIPVVSIASRLSFGWFGDKMDKKSLTAIGFSMICIGLLVFSYAGTGWGLLLLFVVLFGTGFGGTNTMRAVLTRDLFGSQNFATIYGFVSGVGAVGALIGAPLAGYVYDTMSSYRPIWLVFTALTALCIGAMLFMPPARIEERNYQSGEQDH
jgi:MFS transporter, OFA family, oxalate/formate antiporter